MGRRGIKRGSEMGFNTEVVQIVVIHTSDV